MNAHQNVHKIIDLINNLKRIQLLYVSTYSDLLKIRHCVIIIVVENIIMYIR